MAGTPSSQTNSANPASESSDVAPVDPHADKYNDPRVKITLRGVAIGVLILAVASIAALGSIYARKTKLEKTTEFWGQETITALQLGERIELFPRGRESFRRVELTATPGLGHLRRALLDERNFDWSTRDAKSVASAWDREPGENPTAVQLKITDPTAHRFETVEIDLDLENGWVGPSDGSARVRATQWVQPKLLNYFKTVVNVEELRYDFRSK